LKNSFLWFVVISVNTTLIWSVCTTIGWIQFYKFWELFGSMYSCEGTRGFFNWSLLYPCSYVCVFIFQTCVFIHVVF
jgi:hypothetical protein